MLKKYKIALELGGLILFLIIMLPNIIWFAVPAPNDILKAESITPVIDMIGNICQVVFVAILCSLKRKDVEALKSFNVIIGVGVWVALYFAGWVAYYLGVINALVVMLLTIPPCFAFLFYAVLKKNMIAVIPIIGFTCCHFVYGIVNFIL